MSSSNQRTLCAEGTCSPKGWTGHIITTSHAFLSLTKKSLKMLLAGLPEVPGEGGCSWALRTPLTFYTNCS